jgi:hypothetical protein
MPPCSRRTRQGAIRRRIGRFRLLVREGESGYLYQRLTRSIHMSRVVKSAAEIVGSQARGGLQSALITTQERTPNTRGFLCGFDTHNSPAKKGNFPGSGLDHTPIGYCQEKLSNWITKVRDPADHPTMAPFIRVLFRKSSSRDRPPFSRPVLSVCDIHQGQISAVVSAHSNRRTCNALWRLVA